MFMQNDCTIDTGSVKATIYFNRGFQFSRMNSNTAVIFAPKSRC